MNNILNISFISFWQGFNIYDNIFTNLLSLKYNINIEEKPSNSTDLAICSCFYQPGDKSIIKNLRCTKLYYSGENDFPDFNLYDYAITQNRIQFEDRHLYCPFWFFNSLKIKDKKLVNDIDINGSNDTKLLNRDFCSYVVSNNFCAIPQRTKIFEELSKYKKVNSGGRYLNNIGKFVDDKKEFLSKHKFTIAAENSIVNGYITEKIIDAFNANTVPIYVGPKDIEIEFNKNAFININNFSTYNDLVEYVKKVDNDNELYMQYLSSKKLNDNVLENMQNDFENFLVRVAKDKKKFNHLYGRIGLILMQY